MRGSRGTSSYSLFRLSVVFVIGCVSCNTFSHFTSGKKSNPAHFESSFTRIFTFTEDFAVTELRFADRRAKGMAARGDGKGSVCLTAWRPAAAGGEAMMAVEEAQVVVQAPAEPLEAGAAVQGATAPLAAPSASPEPVATDGAVATEASPGGSAVAAAPERGVMHPAFNPASEASVAVQGAGVGPPSLTSWRPPEPPPVAYAYPIATHQTYPDNSLQRALECASWPAHHPNSAGGTHAVASECGACWGALLVQGGGAGCTPHFVPGKLHT